MKFSGAGHHATGTLVGWILAVSEEIRSYGATLLELGTPIPSVVDTDTATVREQIHRMGALATSTRAPSSNQPLNSGTHGSKSLTPDTLHPKLRVTVRRYPLRTYFSA